ncbi:MAG: large conductance mechanosensitive channel protein MscL [Cereibacter changlensis]
MEMLNEFKSFIAKGNVMDMAVGIIIGAAFTAIVSSLVADLINPIIGIITGGIDFSNLFVNLGDGEFASLAAAREAGAPVFAYGAFITAVINFLIIAWVVFLLVKLVNRVKDSAIRKTAAEAAAEPAGPTQEQLLAEIRDLLRSRAA